MHIRYAASMTALVLIITAWLAFAYFMRDTPQIGWILGLGLGAVLTIANWLINGGQTQRTANPAREETQPKPRRARAEDQRNL